MESTRVPHVLIFPFPAQGHINSMLKLAELLSLSELHVTFLNTEYNQIGLNRNTDVETRFACFPGFRFETISDGFPTDQSRSPNFLWEFLCSVETVIQPVFREMLVSSRVETMGRPPVSCIIADGLLGFAINVAQEVGIPCISFRTPSACYYWINFCVPKLIEAGEIPYKDDNMDQTIKSVPGMEGFLRRRDLPSFCLSKELNNPGLQLILNEMNKAKSATAHILNTFEDLEGPIISQFDPHFSKIYTLGPLHALLNSRLKNTSQPFTSSNSLLQTDRTCMTWLDCQASRSVVYVSFGSVAQITHSQMLEFWFGLVNSGKRFLWVIRPDSVTEKDDKSRIPAELQEATKERGCMVDWCPQEEVLIHPSIGSFITHSGWNSTLEAIVAGVPMICWPQFADQPVNSRFVSEVWKIGFDIKDTCDRSIVEKTIKDVMEDVRDELTIAVDQMAENARRSVTEGGSSYRNLDLLIEDIKNNSIGTKYSSRN